MEKKADRTALRFNQAAIIALLLIAFLIDQVWLVAFVAAVMLIGTLWPRHSHNRMLRLANTAVPASVRNLVAGDRPAILYFTTLDCAQCRFQQSPILERFAQQARIAVYAVDAVAQQDLARFYGVMTVPSTVLLNPKLQPVAINHGLATPDRLAQQITTIRS